MKSFAFFTTLIGAVTAAGQLADTNHGEIRRVWEGSFCIRSAMNPHIVIDLERSEPEGHLIAYKYHGGKNQKWTIVQKDDGTFIFFNLATNTYMTTSGANGDQLSCTKGFGFKDPVTSWGMYQNGDGTIGLRTPWNENLVVDLEHADPKSGARIILYRYHAGENQKWILDPGC